MFSFSNSTENPFSQLQYPSFHVSPPSFVADSGDDNINNHRDDLLVGNLLPYIDPVSEAVYNMVVSTKTKLTNPDISRLSADSFDPLNLLPRKKDTHSKVFTAQGPRNRRVRLSIEIARKFFDLQDMLGFDKASKTLDWLLTKSKRPIAELLQMKHNNNGGPKSFSSTYESEKLHFEDQRPSKEKPFMGVNKEIRMGQQNKAAFHLIARESRAKARARARERTRVKILIRKLNESKKPPDLISLTPDQSRSWNQLGTRAVLYYDQLESNSRYFPRIDI